MRLKTITLKGSRQLLLVMTTLIAGCDQMSFNSASLVDFNSYQMCVSEQQIPTRKLRRLTQTQIENTLTDIFGSGLKTDIPSLKDGNPTVGLSTEHNYLKMSDSQLKIWFDSLDAIVTKATNLAADLKPCRTSFTTSCQNLVFDKYALKILRRPINTTEKNEIQNSLTTLKSASATDLNLLEFSLKSILMNPLFFHRSELGIDNDITAKVVDIDSYELASFLSYTIWQSLPDDTLMAKATDKSILLPEILTAEIERLLNDPKAKMLKREFLSEHLKLNNMLTLEKNGAFYSLSATQKTNLHNGVLRMISETEVNDPISDLFLTNKFQVNSTTAPFYGLQAANYTSTFVEASIPSSERTGLLNHPAFLAIHANPENSGIVKRGVYVLEQILCHHIPAPPDDVSGVVGLPAMDETKMTTRELLHVKHSSQPQCAACHKFIDNVGGGFENFDSLGRYRTVEKSSVAIDASGTLFLGNDLNINYRNSPEMARNIASSERFRGCLEQRFFEFVTGENLTESNKCSFDSTKNKSQNNSIRSYFEGFTKDLNFFLKRKKEDI